jgi:hypothetical protein
MSDATTPTKVFIIAHLPPALENAFLQHVRDFDIARPGCHFEMGVEGPDLTIVQMVEALRLDPALSFTKIFDRHTNDESMKALPPGPVKNVIAILPDDKLEALETLAAAWRLVERFKR